MPVPLFRPVTFVPSTFDVAKGAPRLARAVIEVEAATGQA
jgi:hypothetical protein